MSDTRWYLEPRNQETNRCISEYLASEATYHEMMAGGRPVKVIEVPSHAAVAYLRKSRKTKPDLEFITYRRRGNGPLEEARFPSRRIAPQSHAGKSVA